MLKMFPISQIKLEAAIVKALTIGRASAYRVLHSGLRGACIWFDPRPKSPPRPTGRR
jgi:hypothetical protein